MSTSAVQALADLIGRPEGSWTLAEGALAIARVNRPELDPAPVLAQLGKLGEKARASLGGAVHPRFAAAGIARTLFAEEHFRTPDPGQEAPGCFCLDELLAARTGAPTLIAVLFIEVARRSGFRFEPIALPGALLLRRDHGGVVHLFDPAQAARPVSVDDCRRMVADASNGKAEFREGWLRPVSPRQVLARLLGGLKALYWRTGMYEQALTAIRMLLALRPDDPREIRDSGRLQFLMGRHREAIEAFESYLAHNPDGEDADAVRMLLIEARAGLSLRA